jgi:6-pyruvoyltetrahydropterin/6-carboxytetrahydropterin synthase
MDTIHLPTMTKPGSPEHELYLRGKLTLAKEFTFEASHVLPKHEGKCSRLHGHSWVLTVYVDGYVDPECGFVVDYAKLKKCVNEHIIEKVDHNHLGCWDLSTYTAVFGPIFYPSSENLIQAFRRLLEPLIPELAKTWQQVRLKALKLNETCTSECVWVREDK